MGAAILSSWALLLGIAMIMLGNGLQGTLLGVRASLEGFPTGVTGLIMSCYYLGFLSGSTLTPKVVARVGHIRVFAALASLASASVLLHTVFPDPWIWGGMRLLTGFAYAGVYVVAESWLNAQADNQTRGQLLSVYMIVMFGAMAGGQWLLGVGDPGGPELFILISVLVSAALVPIALSTSPAPHFSAPAPLGLGQLYRFSPLGCVATLGTGVAQGVFLGMGSVFAVQAGFSLAQTAAFMSIVILGGVILQWPVGWLSDRFDRRRVLAAVSLLAALTALALVGACAGPPDWRFYGLAGLFGGLCLPLYSLCLAYINDHLHPEQMVSASSSIVLIFGFGSILGPVAAAQVMNVQGPAGLFVCLAIVHLLIGAYALYRMTRRAAAPRTEQGHAVMVAPRATPVAVAAAQESALRRDREAGPETARGEGTAGLSGTLPAPPAGGS